MLNVNVNGRLPAECLIKQIVFRSGGKVLVSSYNVSNLHCVVVDYVGKVVGWHSVRLNENLVVKGGVFNGNVPVNLVVEGGCALGWNLLSDYIGSACGKLFLNLFLGKIAAMSVVHRRNSACSLYCVKLLYSVLVAEAVISLALFDKLKSVVLVHSHTL